LKAAAIGESSQVIFAASNVPDTASVSAASVESSIPVAAASFEPSIPVAAASIESSIPVAAASIVLDSSLSAEVLPEEERNVVLAVEVAQPI
jgi:hypothetical protein